MNPEDKRHPKFKNVADLQPLLYSREMQMSEFKSRLLATAPVSSSCRPCIVGTPVQAASCKQGNHNV